jgi:hypothetical protein
MRETTKEVAYAPCQECGEMTRLITYRGKTKLAAHKDLRAVGRNAPYIKRHAAPPCAGTGWHESLRIVRKETWGRL